MGNEENRHTLIKTANGAMTFGWDSTRSDRTSNDASASPAKPLPTWVTRAPIIS